MFIKNLMMQAPRAGRVDKPEFALQGISAIKDMGIKYKQFGVGPFVTGLLTDIKTARAKFNDDASSKAAEEAIKAVNDAK
jgi:aminopeptidase N